ncbi:MAG: hypothetical protein ACK57B_02385 [Betaproteobacteria bacterium]
MIESTLNLLLAVPALATAAALRPWRALRGAPPWPALALWALLPLLWSLDATTASPLLQPLSGACLLLLMLGWPLTVLALPPVAAAMLLATGLDAAGVLHRVVWLGLMPATLALALGALVRHALPRHLFVYILGRGFFATAIALAGSGALAAWLFGVPATLSLADVMLARLLAAFGDAFITGMLAAIFVAFRPQWLATYADRLYLKPLL